MKALNKFSLTLILSVILCSTKTGEKAFDQYQGGNPDYSEVTLLLYSDSTYFYKERLHMSGSIQDSGKWKKDSSFYYLNSSTKTTWSNIISDEFFRFEMQKFIIYGDTLKFIPKNKNDIRYFDTYYKLHKVTNINR
jgi:hypothetical protein